MASAVGLCSGGCAARFRSCRSGASGMAACGPGVLRQWVHAASRANTSPQEEMLVSSPGAAASKKRAGTLACCFGGRCLQQWGAAADRTHHSLAQRPPSWRLIVAPRCPSALPDIPLTQVAVLPPMPTLLPPLPPRAWPAPPTSAATTSLRCCDESVDGSQAATRAAALRACWLCQQKCTCRVPPL